MHKISFKDLLTGLLISAFILAPCAYAGKVEYPTLYPSPNGDYQNLYSTKASYFATDAGENVGIGTTSATSKLDVRDTGGDFKTFMNVVASDTGGVALKVTQADAGRRGGLILSNGSVNWFIGHAFTGYTDDLQIGQSPYVTPMLMIQTVTGYVGIGTGSPGYNLTVNGTAWCASGLWETSDLRWKKNITPLNDPSEKLLRVRGVEFDWKREEFKDKNFLEGRQIGMIAQELEKEFPELVMTDKDGYKAVAYDKLTAVLLEDLKAQQKEIDDSKSELQTEIELLKKEITELKKR